jgi:Uma2 family endonuclease
VPTNAQSQVVTADQLYSQPSDGYRYELTKGKLVMMSPAGGRHGRIANRIAWLLSNHVLAHQLGEVFAAETGFLVETNPDTVLAGDVAFVEKARLAKLADDSHFLPLAPDLVVEVLSPSDSFSRVEAKALLWLECGCRLVLLVDPQNENAHTYRSRHEIKVYRRDETLDAGDAVPGWSVTVAEFFQRCSTEP